jgi:hypothetical protein
LIGLGLLALAVAPHAASAQDDLPPPPPPPAAAPAPAPTYQAPPPETYKPGTLRDSSEHTRPMMLSLQAYLPWFNGLGFGGKLGFEFPIVHQGFISSLNDYISIEPSFSIASVDYSYGIDLEGFDADNNLTQLIPAVAGIWSFHLSEEFRVYGSVALGFGFYTGDIYNDENINFFYGEVLVGLVYRVGGIFALRAEIGWRGLRGGVAFLF